MINIVAIIKNTKLMIGITFFKTFPNDSIKILNKTKTKETNIVGIIKGDITETKVKINLVIGSIL